MYFFFSCHCFKIIALPSVSFKTRRSSCHGAVPCVVVPQDAVMELPVCICNIYCLNECVFTTAGLKQENYIFYFYSDKIICASETL